jgi:hypothetical protein
LVAAPPSENTSVAPVPDMARNPGPFRMPVRTRAAAHAAIFEWIEVFYNRGGSTAPSAIIPLWTLKPN